MRYSRLLVTTSRQTPRGTSSPGHAALIKGGFIRPLSQGLYSLLPLGLRTMTHLTALVRQEMNQLGGQEVLLPVVTPLELWHSSGRDAIYGDDLVRFTDRGGKRVVLSPTHEEAMVSLVKSVIASYHQLPLFLYQFQTKYRNESKTRAGLIRTREFVMKDGYSFHRSQAELNNFYPRLYHAYERIFEACGVETITADAAVGSMLGERSLEFLMPCEAGDDSVIRCPGCGYAANREVAVGATELTGDTPETSETVPTSSAMTMKSLSRQLDLPLDRLAKTMVFTTGERIILAVVRGDQTVSPEKLARAVGAASVRFASADEMDYLGLDPAYISPVNLNTDVMALDTGVSVVVDPVVEGSSNLAIATNEPDVHLVNANFGRDFEADVVEDIARLLSGAKCLHCGESLIEQRVIELGNIFKLGDYYSRALKLALTDGTGRRVYPAMGAYGIGMGRLMGAIAEAHADRRGIRWPEQLAPFRFLLMGIGRSRAVARAADQIADELGDSVLYDDRKVSISAKFRDADLIGVPHRIVLSARTLERGEAEMLSRSLQHIRRVSLDAVAGVAQEIISAGGGAG